MNLNTPISVSSCDPYMDRPPVAIYVHGLASGANATTFDKLAKRFPQFIWMSTDFGEELAENVEHLNDMIRSNYPQLIVGTSMGGFFDHRIPTNWTATYNYHGEHIRVTLHHHKTQPSELEFINEMRKMRGGRINVAEAKLMNIVQG